MRRNPAGVEQIIGRVLPQHAPVQGAVDGETHVYARSRGCAPGSDPSTGGRPGCRVGPAAARPGIYGVTESFVLEETASIVDIRRKTGISARASSSANS